MVPWETPQNLWLLLINILVFLDRILGRNKLKMGISIKIEEIKDTKFKIKTSGRFSNIITDTDRNKFGLSDNNLKEAVKCHKGQRPSDVYLRSPTPWGDMYSTYHLDQTEKITVVKKTKVIDVTSRPVIIKRQTFENKNPSVSATFNTSIEEELSNSVSSSWTNDHNVSISQSIGYDIKALRGETSLSYSRGWGSTETKSKSVTLKSGSSSEMTLNPGQSATVELTANRKIAKIEITYECYLEGDVGINYHERYKGFHFHFEPIEDILDAGGIENSIIVKEVMELELYCDSSIVVK